MGQIGSGFVSANSITTILQRISTIFISGLSFSGCFLTGQILGEGRTEDARRQGYTYLILDALAGLVLHLSAFKAGAQKLWLKRMGRTEDARWYDEVDFSDVSVLVIEWTHGNSDLLQGVDIPVLLNSTPEETRAHRRARGRDGKTDSPFTTMVLEIEQKELDSCAHKAKIIVSKSGELLRYEEYRALMEAQGV